MDIALGLTLGGRRGTADDGPPLPETAIIIDAVTGNDNNDGSPSAPLRTLAAGRAAALAAGPGVVLGLAAGSVFRESLNLTGLDQVTITAHGDVLTRGAPEVRGDEELPGPWQSAADRGDAFGTVYSQPFTWQGGAATPNWLQFFEHPDGTDDVLGDGVINLAWAASLGDCAATPGSFWIDPVELGANPALEFSPTSAAGIITAHIHPHGSTDPRSDGKAYFGSARQIAVSVGHDSTVRQVVAYRAGDDVGSIQGLRRCVFDRCLAFDGVTHQMRMGTGRYQECIGWHRFADTRRGATILDFHSPDADAGPETCTWRRSMAIATPQVRDTTNPEGFGGSRATGVPNYDDWIIEDCALVECRLNSLDVTSVTVSGTSLRNAPVQINDHGPGGSFLGTDISVVYDRIPAVSKAGILWSPEGDTLVSFDGLRLSVPEGVTGFSASRSAMVTGSILEVRGSGGDGGNTFAVFTSSLAGSVSLHITTSIIKSDEGFLRLASDDPATANNNVYSGVGRWYANGGTVATGGNLANWQSATGLDVGSIASPITIVDPLNGDWTITGSVGATGAGLTRPAAKSIHTPTTLSQAMSLIAGRDLTGGDFAPEDFA